jgi:hypothetical protein
MAVDAATLYCRSPSREVVRIVVYAAADQGMLSGGAGNECRCSWGHMFIGMALRVGNLRTSALAKTRRGRCRSTGQSVSPMDSLMLSIGGACEGHLSLEGTR